MARPVKEKKVCGLPKTNKFGPIDECLKAREFIHMTVEEYETIRLIDYEGFTQEECSDSMHVARTTVQGIYSDARKKIARGLIEGLPIKICGGNYRLCNGQGQTCGRRTCSKRSEEEFYENNSSYRGEKS